MSQDPTQPGPYEQRPGHPDPRDGGPREGTAPADRPAPNAPDFAPPAPGQQPYGHGFGPAYGQPGPAQQPYGQPYGQPSPTAPQYGQQAYPPGPYGAPQPGQQAPYGPPLHGAEHAPRDDNPLNALFDLSFTQYATPMVIRVLYILLILVGGISWLVSIVSGFAWSGTSGLGALVGGGIVLAAWILLVRVTLEFFLSIIRVAQDAHAIREGLEEVRAERAGTASSDKGETSGNTTYPA